MMDLCERALLRKVDAVVATAARLVERKRSASGRGYYLPQGVNYEHFAAPRAIPAEMAELPRPIIGFAGGVGAAVDAETIRDLARANTSGSIVFVGPLHGDVSNLQAPNVHLLGARPYAELPAYVQAFDVGIIPYVENDWTRAVDPLKLLEYLAAGIPVVTSPLPEVEKYRDVVHIAPLGPAFAVAAMAAAYEGNPTARARARRVAQANTWENRADRFLEIVREVVAVKSARSAAAVAHPAGAA
jgi:glycosyltransferase involved in cell wall biosynthesis